MPVGVDERAGRTEVVLDVTRAEDAAGIDILEAGEDLDRSAADDLTHDVQPSAVAHGDHRLVGAVLGALLDGGDEERNERRDALDREALRTDVTRLDGLFEDLGAHQLVEDPLPVDPCRRRLHALGDPGPPFGLGEVHELDGERVPQ